jgi:3-oxoacyl-[acyl-carrier protein] reductase
MAYGVARAGIECLTKGLAREGAPYNILVNCVAPGFIDTKFQTTDAGKTKEEYERRMKLVPLKRAGRPEEVATVILYLLSDWSSFITGECIAVSGGDWL